MHKIFKVFLVVNFLIFQSSISYVYAGETGIVTNGSSTSTTSSNSTNNTASTTSTTSTTSTISSSKSSIKPAAGVAVTAAAVVSSSASSTNSSTILAPSWVNPNVQATNVDVQSYNGSAGLHIPIQVPSGRAGIQPKLSLVYSSSNRQLGNAGVGWDLDLGSIQISTKKGVPKYDGTDIFTKEQNGVTQDLVEDPNTANLYHMEVEGAFVNIQYYTTYWVITDKKGIKYYYGNYGSTTGNIQNDPANPAHIFRWALSRVEDLSGNYMTISYLTDNGQLYPQTISYTGNDQSSLLLSPYAQVSISYTSTTSPSISYISKFLVKTALRINQIAVTVNSSPQTFYNFHYHASANSNRDLLDSVQQVGADGSSTLPAITFSYNEALPQWQLSSNWSVPSNMQLNTNFSGTVVDSGVRVFDVNGDGYPDFMRAFVQWANPVPINTVYTYLNNKSNGWNQASSWTMPNSWNQPFYSGPFFSGIEQYGPISLFVLNGGAVALADFYGNGLTDIVAASSLGLTEQFSTNYIYENNISSGSFNFDSGWSMPGGIPLIGSTAYSLGAAYPYFQTGVLIQDVTGNGYPDFVQSNGSSQGVYINQYPQGSKSFVQNTSYTFPNTTYTNFTNGAILADLTGDGMADILYLKGGVLKAFLNNGSGWTETGDFENIQGLGDLTNASTQVVDLTGNGLPDLVITTNGNRSNATILLNTGSGWVQWQGNMGDFNFFDHGTQFFDPNADGMMGYLTYEYNGSPEVYINANKPVDLLTGVNNGIGAQTSITYDSDYHYNNTYMPYFMPVVKSTATTVTTPNGSQTYSTSYDYSGGLWDTTYREFDGFQNVTVTDPYGNYVVTNYLQNHWEKGLVAQVSAYDSKNNLYDQTVNTWQTQTIATNPNFLVGGTVQVSEFPYISRTDKYVYDIMGVNPAIRTAQQFTYGENPQYGDITQVVNEGQVNLTSGSSIDPNMTTTTMTYVYNTTKWVIGLPAVEITQDESSNQISKTSFFYDGDTTGSASPSLGHLTAKVNWLGSSAEPDPKTTYTYDGYSNPLTTTDPDGNTTTITYDASVHMFPVQTSNALKQTTSMTYYGIGSQSFNNGAGLQGLWGQQASITDANKQTAYTAYDVFGRPSATVSPLDTISLPTDQKSYNIQSDYIQVTDTARVTSGSSNTISSASFYDGLGRVIESKSLGPTAGQYIASGQTVYDNRGLPVTKYLPYFTSNSLNTLDSIPTSGPAAQLAYDSLGRVITKTNPDGTYSSTAYDQWTTTTTDENGHKQVSTVDAFGHLVLKQEYSGADGRSPNYPSAAYTIYAQTNYTYDPRGDLVQTTDALNNWVFMHYDNLGRKIWLGDPDLGQWNYGYDNNGNLVWQTDGNGNAISFTYDALNRMINKTDAVSATLASQLGVSQTAGTFSYSYNYDPTTQAYGIGRLGSANYNGGSASFVYDQLGREITSTKSVAGSNYTVQRQYNDLNQLQQLQYPDGSSITYLYNQGGQVSGVADSTAVVNGVISSNKEALGPEVSHDRLALLDKILGIDNAYAQSSGTAPVVSITSPANGSFIPTGYTVTLTATASETNGTISKVAFYNGTSLIGTGTLSSGSYTYTWKNVTGGYYALTAVATDANGVSTTSSVVSLLAQPATPIIDIFNPVNQSSFVAGNSITINTIAMESYNGVISKVSFYNGTTLLGSSTSGPVEFSFTWNNVPAGTYSLTAVATDEIGQTATSSPVTITVASTPTITTQPVNKTVTAPATAMFSVVATGTPAPTYQWQSEAPGATSFTAISGATSSSYTTSATTTAMSGIKYECVVTTSAGSVTSSAATLTVNAAVAPTITTQPTSQTVTAPAAATFTVAATGTPAPTYQWQSEAPGATNFTAISGATSPSYTTSVTTAAMNGTRYEVAVTNLAGTVTSNAVTLTVNSASAPVITTQPINRTITAPTTAGFTVYATGTPTPTYQWYSEAPGATRFTAISGATAATYITPATTVAMSGTKYEVIVTNSVGSVTSSAVTLTVNPTPVAPMITTQPASKTVIAPATVTFTVVATGTPAPTYQWYSEASGATSFTAISGATSASYTTPATTTTMSATKYQVVITNSAGSVTSSAVTLTVNPTPVAPMITTQPTAQTVTASATATFMVMATGTPTPTYQWESEASGATSFTAISGATSSSYTTLATTTAMSGTKYEVIVTNSAGSVTSSAVTLTVNAASVAPTITTQPVSKTVTTPATATFTVVATGTPTPTYQWMSEASGATSFTAISAATSASYTTSTTTTSMNGTKYEAVVTNSAGSVTSSAVTLTVNAVPVIATQPVSKTVTAPATAAFTVVATGTPAPAYQWMSEASGATSFTAISGATSASYTTAATTTSMSGTKYEVVITNSAGNVTSSAVTLTVNEASPTVSLSANSGTYAPPATVTLTATASQTGGTISSVSFYNGTTLLGTVTSSPYVYTWNNVSAGNYTLTAKATNNTGRTTVSNSVNISVIAPNVYVQSINYNANGQITQIQYGNGVTTAYTYDPNMFRLTRIHTTNAQAVVIQDLNYTYDSAGQVLTITDNVNTGANSQTQTFTYDAFNRLVMANGAYGSKTYAYDAIGNITQKDGLTYTYAGGTHPNGTTSGPQALTSLSNGMIFDYDYNGNMTSAQNSSNVTQYTYDSQNRLNAVKVNGATVSAYQYDDTGARMEKTVYRRDLALYNDNVNLELFGNPNNTPPLSATAANTVADTTIYVGNLYESESNATNGSSRTSKFIYLGNKKVAMVNSDGSLFYYHTDHLTGTNVLTDSAGTVREFTSYDSYGQTFSHQKYGNTFASAWYYFTSKQLDDETGLNFFGARYYNPLIGRFITPDSKVPAPDNPENLNRYMYCYDNPVNLLDPDGHTPVDFLIALGTATYQGALAASYRGGVRAELLGGLAGAFVGLGIGALSAGLPPNPYIGAISGAAGNIAGNFVANKLNGEPLGQAFTENLAFAGISGAINGAIGSKIESAVRGVSVVPWAGAAASGVVLTPLASAEDSADYVYDSSGQGLNNAIVGAINNVDSGIISVANTMASNSSMMSGSVDVASAPISGGSTGSSFSGVSDIGNDSSMLANAVQGAMSAGSSYSGDGDMAYSGEIESGALAGSSSGMQSSNISQNQGFSISVTSSMITPDGTYVSTGSDYDDDDFGDLDY